MAALGKLNHGSYSYFALPALHYLAACFATARVAIGSRSSKFHKADAMFFDAIYPFKGDTGHRFYR